MLGPASRHASMWPAALKWSIRAFSAESSYKMLINGKLVTAEQSFGVINPSTGEVFAQCPSASKAQVFEAVEGAKAAFDTWKKSSFEERKKCIECAIAKANERMGDLTALLVKEQGKPTAMAQWELGAVEAFHGHFSNLQVKDEILSETKEEKVIKKHVPLGVVAGIVPWNFPVLMATWKMGEALMTGNTLVIKPSPYTPLATLLYGEIVAECFPPGVFNIVTGDNDTGELLTGHPDVAKISFTGSTATGKRIQSVASGTLKRLTLELGGNDPAIVLEDADPKVVAPQIFQHAMANTGQVCIAIKRCYVHESKHDELVDELTKCAKASLAKVGDGFKKGMMFGPLNNKMQLDKVVNLTEDAKKVGGTITAGGAPLPGPGYFFPPTIVSGLKDGHRLVDEEQFGPVLPVIKFSNVDDVIKKANATLMGLGGSVWGSDEDKAAAVAAEIEAGTVWVNNHLHLSPDVPFGGLKQSGLGGQMGDSTIANHTDKKILRIKKATA